MKIKTSKFLSLKDVVLFLVLFLVGIVVWDSLLLPKKTSPPVSEIHEISNWQQLNLRGKRTGPANAPVQIIEFFDYQCPYCKKVQPTLETLKEKYPNRISVVYEHYPLATHQYAFESALAVECARRQNAFDVYHDLLFANQNELGFLSYDSLAVQANIKDRVTFNSCMKQKKTAGIVESGQKLGNQLNITGIPTFLINSTLVSGALSTKQLDRLIQDEFNKEE